MARRDDDPMACARSRAPRRTPRAAAVCCAAVLLAAACNDPAPQQRPATEQQGVERESSSRGRAPDAERSPAASREEVLRLRREMRTLRRSVDALADRFAGIEAQQASNRAVTAGDALFGDDSGESMPSEGERAEALAELRDWTTSESTREKWMFLPIASARRRYGTPTSVVSVNGREEWRYDSKCPIGGCLKRQTLCFVNDRLTAVEVSGPCSHGR